VSKHATPGCTCAHVHMPDHVCDIIRNGGIPILTLSESENGVYHLTAEEHNAKSGKTPPFIAISHVWSDGMGNPESSSLPGCLVASIQKKVDAVPHPDRPARVGFWMDTLCIPVSEDLRELRKLCIASMRHVYSLAYAVLVLEASVEAMSSHASVIEKTLAIYTTKWLRRLWTYQEGSLAKTLYFQLQDGAQEMQTFIDDATQLSRRQGTEGCFAPFITKAEIIVSSHFAFVNHIISDEIMEGNMDNNRSMFLLPMASSYTSRQTSRKTDETICAATILAIDVMPILSIKEDKEHGLSADDVADIRMQMLLCTIGTFDAFFIFNARPRLKQQGFRWAPRSFMGGLEGSFGGHCDTEFGLPEAKVVKWGPDLSRVGLQVQRLPGLPISSLPESFTSTQSSRFYLDPAGLTPSSFCYAVTLVPDHNGEYPVWNVNASYYLVLAHALKSNPESVAVLGKVIAPGPKLRHECLAWVELKQKNEGLGKDGLPVILIQLNRRDSGKGRSWVIV
ncbi:hypothetical protein EUX98_g9618, partial [Antrodiella citrinella]